MIKKLKNLINSRNKQLTKPAVIHWAVYQQELKKIFKMLPKEKAQELVSKFKDYVHGYVGSSMLTNYEYPEQILSQAKKVAMIVADEMLHQYTTLNADLINALYRTEKVVFWQQVKIEIDHVSEL